MLEILAFAIIGMFFGVFTGMVPGIHVNTIVILIISALPFLLEHFSAYEIASLIISMSVVHSFVNFIPAILIGAPQEDNVLSVLPGHRLLLQGHGYEAIQLTVIGGLGAIILSIATLPAGVKLLPIFYSHVREVLPYLLACVLIYMIYSERERFLAALVIACSGILGFLILNYEILPPKYALFPTLTGLFGMSTLLTSLAAQVKIPRQEIRSSEGYYPGGVAIGTLGGMLTGLLPSIGSSQSALIIQNVFKTKDEKAFLVALGGVNTSDAIYALFALYLIGNPRSGASIAVEHIMTDFTLYDFLFMASIVLAAAFFATFATLTIAKISLRKVQEIDYAKFSKLVLLFLFALIFALTGVRGVLIAATATAIGFTAHLAGVKRSNCMAVLVIPTILYFL
ncbi:MAG: tripartite tricarboxylate transporter permease [Methanobacteriota archaeon]